MDLAKNGSVHQNNSLFIEFLINKAFQPLIIRARFQIARID